MRSKFLALVSVFIATFSAPMAWADQDFSDDDSDAPDDVAGAAQQDEPLPPAMIPQPGQQGGMPPLPFMPGYSGGSPFDGGLPPGMPLPFMPGYSGGSPFGPGGPPPPPMS